MQLIDGKAIPAAQIKAEIAQEVERRKPKVLKVPHLAAILVGHDGGSETYVAVTSEPAQKSAGSPPRSSAWKALPNSLSTRPFLMSGNRQA